jgi:hypothetical protein
MDLLQEIEKKAQILSSSTSHEGIQAVTRHIKAAERYLLRARGERDDDLFNDVIYRTNQAFEGMLKEAYSVLTDKDGTKLSPHQIEQHLVSESVLASRVLDLFTNYRQQWRNPSTHNHRLFFGEQEALLAIVSVSAFTTILLDQIIEKVSYTREREEISNRKDIINRRLNNYGEGPLHEQVILLLDLFSDNLQMSRTDLNTMREVEVIGHLSAFITLIDSSIEVSQQQILLGEKQLRPDFIFSKQNEKVVLELKRPGYSERNIELS